MSLIYKKTILFSVAILSAVIINIVDSNSPFAGEYLTHEYNEDSIEIKSEDWYSQYFTGSSYMTTSEEPVLAFSACASNEDIALMLASAALSTHDQTKSLSSKEKLSNDGSYRVDIQSKTSSLELKYVVLRKEQVRSAPSQTCVLITQE